MSLNPDSLECQLHSLLDQELVTPGFMGAESLLPMLQSLPSSIHQDAFENFEIHIDGSPYAHEIAQYEYYSTQTTTAETFFLEEADQQVYDELTGFLARPDSQQLVVSAFGDEWNYEQLIGGIQSYLTGIERPDLEVIASSAHDKSFRASYSEATETIYLDQRFLSLTTVDEFVSVYLEELGHYWQSKTGQIDIAGDEGELLAALISGKSLSGVEQQQIRQQNDHGILYYDGQSLLIEQASWLQTEELRFSEGRPGIFHLPDNDLGFLTTLNFQAGEKDASYRNEIGFYLTDGEGRVNGITPGSAGYTEAVLRQAERRTLFNPNATEGNWQEIELEGNTHFGLYLIADGSGEQYLNLPPDDADRPEVYFSYTPANRDGVEHMRWQALGNGVYTVRWEDLWGGGDNDFNDATFTLKQQGIRTPGNSGQLVPFTVDWVSSDASYANEMGFYYVDDAQGRINGIAPGE